MNPQSSACRFIAHPADCITRGVYASSRAAIIAPRFIAGYAAHAPRPQARSRAFSPPGLSHNPNRILLINPLQPLVRCPTCMMLALIPHVLDDLRQIPRPETHDAITALPLEHLIAPPERVVHVVRCTALQLSDEFANQ